MKREALVSLKARILILFLLMGSLTNVKALEFDWSGQFWSEFNYISDYTMDSSGASATYDPARAAAGGYYIPGGGSNNATFQSLFLRLKPKIVVNDNVYIKSEWWVGDPIFGIFGNALPYSQDQRWYYSSQSRGSIISAQRFWGEFVTDLGVIQVGRVPLNWGLGIVWNSGDNLWDRYMSTGDAIRWVAKFGSFTFIPSFIVNSAGISIGGGTQVNNATGAFIPSGGTGGVQDFSLLFKYENLDDELEGGVNLLRRLSLSGQDPTYNVTSPNGIGGPINYIVYDLFARKKFPRLTLGAEVPITSGSVGSSNYQSFGLATEINWKTTDALAFQLKSGYASGQPTSPNNDLSNYQAFYFNPNYHIAMILFNYQLANFYGPQTMNNPNLAPSGLASPYDNPIVNAAYIALSSQIKPSDKWTIRPALIYARAPEAAGSSGFFFNTNTRRQVQNTSGIAQGNELGFEFDLGFTFQWDEYFQFAWDNGVFIPGNYYAFSNLSGLNALSPVIATSFRIGVNF